MRKGFLKNLSVLFGQILCYTTRTETYVAIKLWDVYAALDDKDLLTTTVVSLLYDSPITEVVSKQKDNSYNALMELLYLKAPITEGVR